MIDFHKEKGADATIAVIKVPMEEASRFGIMNTDEDLKIVEFEEKPQEPKNNMASMGVYVFEWEVVLKYLQTDAGDPASKNDFGKNIIPAMLSGGESLYAYPFEGYWKDVGTIESLWEANMELLDSRSQLDLSDTSWRIYSRNPNQPPHYVGNNAVISQSLVTEGCFVYGKVENSVLFPGVVVEEGAHVKDSIIMADTLIGRGAVIDRSILDERVRVGEGAVIGSEGGQITVLGKDITVQDNGTVTAGRMIDPGTVL
jgi:glucose-1-phosphate adenylyltransferase